MENSIIGRGVLAMSNSIIQKNTVYLNTRLLFETIKKLIFFKIFHNFGLKGKGGGSDPSITNVNLFFQNWSDQFGQNYGKF